MSVIEQFPHCAGNPQLSFVYNVSCIKIPPHRPTPLSRTYVNPTPRKPRKSLGLFVIRGVHELMNLTPRPGEISLPRDVSRPSPSYSCGQGGFALGIVSNFGTMVRMALAGSESCPTVEIRAPRQTMWAAVSSFPVKYGQAH